MSRRRDEVLGRPSTRRHEHPSGLIDICAFRDKYLSAVRTAPEASFTPGRCDISNEIEFGDRYLSANVLVEGTRMNGAAPPPLDAASASSSDAAPTQLTELASRVASSKLSTLRFLIDNADVARALRGEPNFLSQAELAHESAESVTPVDEDDVVICATLYNAQRPEQRAQEYRLLASQPLTALRDCLYCLSDKVAAAERTSAAGYFFIEKVFYDDTRTTSVRYSTPILEWAQRDPSVVPEYVRGARAATMQSTRFIDLKLRLNCPYLYVHRGDCQHILMFSELRLLHAEDRRNATAYPLQTFQSRIHRMKCRVCKVYPARYITYNDKMTTSNPFFFCETCYILLHYDSEGRLIYDDFKVYDYVHEM